MRATVIWIGVALIVCAIAWVIIGLAFPTPGIIPARLLYGPPMLAASIGTLAILAAVFFGGERR